LLPIFLGKVLILIVISHNQHHSLQSLNLYFFSHSYFEKLE
jgi:hypothetical protein